MIEKPKTLKSRTDCVKGDAVLTAHIDASRFTELVFARFAPIGDGRTRAKQKQLRLVDDPEKREPP
jgi:hypothetical protein